jgi:rubrerythrin
VNRRWEMNGYAREDEERGRGIPLTDVERIARHYNVSIEEAFQLLTVYSVEELLPERGYGLALYSPEEIIGYTLGELGPSLNTMEASLPTGGKAKVQLCTTELPLQADLEEFYQNMLSVGLHTTRPTAYIDGGVAVTEFVLTKGSPQWEVIIPLIIPAMIIGLITFGIFKIETITKALVPILLITFGGLIVFAAVMRKPMEAAATKYLERSPSTLPKGPSGQAEALAATQPAESELRSLMDKLTIYDLESIVSHLGFEPGLSYDDYPIYSRDESKAKNMDYIVRWVARHPEAKGIPILMQKLEAKVREKGAYPVRGEVPGTHYITWKDFTSLPSYQIIVRAVNYPHDYRKKCSPVTKDGYVSVDALYNMSAWASWKSSSLDPSEKRIADEINKLSLYELMRLNKGRRSDQPALFPEKLLPTLQTVPAETSKIKSGLVKSIKEEQEAADIYHVRGEYAASHGDPKTANLYQHIMGEEFHHRQEFNERRQELESFMPQTELRDKVRELWIKACQWEGIPPESKFVAFSENNPYMKEYHEAMGRLLRFKQVQMGQWQPAIEGPRFITIIEPGQTALTQGSVVSIVEFEKENERVEKLGLRQARGEFLKGIVETGGTAGPEEHYPQTQGGNRTAYYIQYWAPKSDPLNSQPYYWKGAFKTLYEALDEATECERKKPDAFGIEVYSQEERWEPFEEAPKFGRWELIEGTMKIYDRKGNVAFDEKQPATIVDISPETLAYLAKAEGDPKGSPTKFCCRLCGECAPEELLEEGKFPERIAWLRHHYKEKHPGMWGKMQAAVLPTEPTPLPQQKGDLEYLADSPEFLTQTIEQSGYKDKLDTAFQEALKRARA